MFRLAAEPKQKAEQLRQTPTTAMLRYTNKAITIAEMISRLIDLAKDLRDAQHRGEELGLSKVSQM